MFLFCAVYMVYVVFVMNVCWGFAFWALTYISFCFLNESLSFSELHHVSEAHTGQSGVSMLQMSQQI